MQYKFFVASSELWLIDTDILRNIHKYVLFFLPTSGFLSLTLNQEENPRTRGLCHSMYFKHRYIDIRKEKRKCKSRESWTKVSTAIPCHPLLLPAFLFMRKSAFSIDLFSERLLMSEIAVSSGGILFCGTKTSEFPILWKMSTWRPPT